MTQTQTQLITIIAAIIAIFEILQESTPNQIALATKPTHRQRRLKCPTQIKRERETEREERASGRNANRGHRSCQFRRRRRGRHARGRSLDHSIPDLWSHYPKSHSE